MLLSHYQKFGESKRKKFIIPKISLQINSLGIRTKMMHTLLSPIVVFSIEHDDKRKITNKRQGLISLVWKKDIESEIYGVTCAHIFKQTPDENIIGKTAYLEYNEKKIFWPIGVVHTADSSHDLCTIKFNRHIQFETAGRIIPSTSKTTMTSVTALPTTTTTSIPSSLPTSLLTSPCSTTIPESENSGDKLENKNKKDESV